MGNSMTLEDNGAFQLDARLEQPGDKIVGHEIWSAGACIAGPVFDRAVAHSLFQKYAVEDARTSEDASASQRPRLKMNRPGF